MGASRSVLLALSASPWLRGRAPRWRFVRKAARRFMPGEQFEDALAAARPLAAQRIGAVFTQLGENVTEAAHAGGVLRHYAGVLSAIRASGLDAHLSVKPTQLGLDLNEEVCHANLRQLVEQARTQDTFVWIDMEQHAYLEQTLAIYRRLVAEFPNVGVCLQAYLYRTGDDLRSLVPLGGGIRLVKGAYREPAAIAYPKKRDVDANYLALAALMLEVAGRPGAPRVVFGTHDRAMHDAILGRVGSGAVRRDAFEFHLLYGIARAHQTRLANDGYGVRVLISYGDEWFAWYMRRLAERPANVWFALRSIFP